MFTPTEKAALAKAAYYVARKAGDRQVMLASVLAYRAARREMRRPVRTRVNPREASALCRAFRPTDSEYVPDWL